MSEKRRTAEQLMQVAAEVHRLIAGGMRVEPALEKANLAHSVWSKYKHKVNGGAAGSSGSVNVASLPPRPKKGGKGGHRPPRPVDMTDLASVVGRLSKIDKKLAGVDELKKERNDLAFQALKLLRKKQ